MTKKSKGSPHKRVRLTFEFLARNPNPQIGIAADDMEEMLKAKLKEFMQFHAREGDPSKTVAEKVFGTNFRMSTENKTGILHHDWFPIGSLNNVHIRVEELDDKGNRIAKKPRLGYRLVAFFRGIG